MPYDKKTNQWKNTTPLLRERKPFEVKNPNKMTDEQLLEDAKKEQQQTKFNKKWK